jgi:hypothetical protein
LSPDFRNSRMHWFDLRLPVGAAAGLWHGLRCRFARGQGSECSLTAGTICLGRNLSAAYQTVMSGAPGSQEALRRYGLTVVLVPANSPIGAALRDSADWKPSYRDTTAAVFLLAK